MPTQVIVHNESLHDDFLTNKACWTVFEVPFECHTVSHNLPLLSIPFYGHLKYNCKWIKITEKLRKPINVPFLSDLIGFYGIVWKLTAFFSIVIASALWSEN